MSGLEGTCRRCEAPAVFSALVRGAAPAPDERTILCRACAGEMIEEHADEGGVAVRPLGGWAPCQCCALAKATVAAVMPFVPAGQPRGRQAMCDECARPLTGLVEFDALTDADIAAARAEPPAPAEVAERFLAVVTPGSTRAEIEAGVAAWDALAPVDAPAVALTWAAEVVAGWPADVTFAMGPVGPGGPGAPTEAADQPPELRYLMEFLVTYRRHGRAAAARLLRCLEDAGAVYGAVMTGCAQMVAAKRAAGRPRPELFN